MITMLESERMDGLIANYFAKKIGRDELRDLHHWIKKSDENKAYFMQAQEIWFSAIGVSDQPSFDEEDAFKRFQVRAEGDKRRRIHLQYTFRRIAAVILFVGFTGGVYWLGHYNMNHAMADVLIEAPLGSKTKLYLPDGTLVWLNAGSSIQYGQTFGAKNRKVTFRGEGYFEVTKNKRIPFQIETPEVVVTVLGTKFNFRNYADDHEVSVTLLEGMVCVGCNDANNSSYCLKPNQQAIYDKKLKTTKITSVDAKSASIWIQGYLFFNEERLSDIAKALERNYNVNVIISDSTLLECRFYGNFVKADQHVEKILDDLSLTGKFKYQIKGKNVVLSLK